MWGYSNGYLALLEEEEDDYKVYAIEQLLSVVDLEWAQIGDKLDVIEKLAKNPDFSARRNASLLAAKLLYRLGNFDEAVSYAIGTEDLFDTSATDDFSMVIKSQLIARCRNIAKSGKEIDSHTASILTRILDDMIAKNDIAACYCIAIETRQELFIKKCVEAIPDMISYAIRVANKDIHDPEYRSKVLRLLADYVQDHCSETQTSKLYQSLDDPEAVAAILITLASSGDTDQLLLAYQIAFDLAENASQKFRAPIIQMLFDDLPVIKDILTRQTPLQIQLDFMYKKVNDDVSLLNAIKTGLNTDQYQSIHSAAVILFSYMYANTAIDKYYRENLQWFTGVSKWHLFLTIAAVGAAHIGHLDAALTVLGPYLSSKTEPEITGGALYALGLIYANYAWDQRVNDTIRNSLRNSRQMYVQYGASLALGLISIGSQNNDDYQMLKDIIMADQPVPETGEAAGYGIGMVMLGCGQTEEGEELITFAENCDHDKINRGLAMALALMMYGQENNADKQIDRLLNERKAVLRESACWTLALAYVGTGSNDAVQKLLHIAVSDVSNDVRRIAVIGVGFVMSRNPEKIPEMLGLLTLSYNPFVRSGASLAIGFALAGTGNTEAIELIKPLLKDTNQIVFQSATIAMAMLLQQQSDAQVPYCKEFRDFLRKRINKRHTEMISYTISVAYGILYAAGRNSVISCNTLRGENSILSTVGMAIFCNYFYFLPLSLMLPLAFHPTAMIGVDENLHAVDWPVLSHAKPSLFANPPPFDSEKEEVKIADAVKLSISKAKTPEEIKAEEEAKAEEARKKIEELALEPQEEVIVNPARVTLSQLKYIDITYSADYEPVTEAKLGFTMLRRKTDPNVEQQQNQNEEEKKE